MRRLEGSVWAAVLVAVAAAAALSSAPSAWAQADFTWSGGAPAGTPGWSNASNWAGGVAPSGTVGTLAFPLPTGAGCTANPPTATCFTSTNDVTGLSVNALSVDDGAPVSSVYQISGNAITLGGGGLTARTTSSSFGSALLRLPITLGAPQTWSIDGNGNGSQIQLSGNVTGPAADSLGISLSHQTFLGLSGSDVEVGPVTITGGSPPTSGAVAMRDGKLNATDGSPVSLTDAGLVAENAGVGALTSTRGQLQIGQEGLSGAGTLTVNGALKLDGQSAVNLFINRAGTGAGTDYSQLSVAGAADLGNAQLRISGGNDSGKCPSLMPGDVDTLLTATGSFTGTFAGVPDGTTVELLCSPRPGPNVRINYSPQTVTATVLTTFGGPVPPPVIGKTASVVPEKGVVLIKLPAGASAKAAGLSAAASSHFVPLTAGATVPLGATLDTKRGQVQLSTATTRSGMTQSGHFSRGVFTVEQGRKNPLTTLSMTGGGLGRCHTKLPRGGVAKQSAGARKRPRRTLFSNVHGHFRSRGRNSEATVRGTKWTMTDTCAGTLTTVRSGTVRVRDFRLRKTKVVTAGHHYLARSLKLRKHRKR